VVSNPRQIELLRYLRRRNSVTNQEYVAMMNISPRTGLRDLKDMMDKGLILRIGSRRGAIYKIRDAASNSDNADPSRPLNPSI
jgi:ATP-dependent DNA helicase RecG